MEFVNQETITLHPCQLLVCPFCRFHFPLSDAFYPFQMELERSISLLQLMERKGLVPSQKEEMNRRNAINNLQKIVMQWIKIVAYHRGFPESYIREASARILVYGSYGLGVYDCNSDIDALCVGPCFATMEEEFFIVLRNMLASRPEVSEIVCIRDARVPLMRFNFDGVPIDLPYSKLNTMIIPENLDVLNSIYLTNIDEVSWRSLSGVRANQRILQLVPDIAAYQSLLRCVKFWAKRRGIYGHAFGFFGGVHLAVLAAFICWWNPESPLSTMVSVFFQTFALWPWPTPVILGDGKMALTPNYNNLERFLMPIQFPSSCPAEFCYSKITRSTFNRIRKEFLRGHALTKDFLRPDFDWTHLFETFVYNKIYAQFLKIRISTSQPDEFGEWVGWVKSRMRYLLIKLEELQGFCDPNPTEYIDHCVPEPSVVYYWGLSTGKSYGIDLGSIKADFMKNISNGYEGRGTGRIELEVVAATELPKS